MTKRSTRRRSPGRRRFSRSVQADLDRLSPQEAKLLRLRFGLRQPPRTLEEVAAALGLPATEAERRETTALQRLRWLSLPESCRNENGWDEV
jgi:DNA-directed RNA polymerase sigma subunit (sigma70/sigma32)